MTSIAPPERVRTRLIRTLPDLLLITPPQADSVHRIITARVVKIISASLLICIMVTKALSFPLPSPVLSHGHTQALLPIGGYLASPACYPCWEAVINVIQLSSSLLFAADGARISSQHGHQPYRYRYRYRQKASTAMSSIALSELAFIQEVLAAQGFRRWHKRAELTPGARYYHAMTTMGSGIGLLGYLRRCQLR